MLQLFDPLDCKRTKPQAQRNWTPPSTATSPSIQTPITPPPPLLSPFKPLSTQAPGARGNETIPPTLPPPHESTFYDPAPLIPRRLSPLSFHLEPPQSASLLLFSRPLQPHNHPNKHRYQYHRHGPTDPSYKVHAATFAMAKRSAGAKSPESWELKELRSTTPSSQGERSRWPELATKMNAPEIVRREHAQLSLMQKVDRWYAISPRGVADKRGTDRHEKAPALTLCRVNGEAGAL